MTTQIFTRQDLYDLVWTRAVSKVAPELGISDVALRKQCAKHSIPVPDARYWGRFHAGRKVERVKLPEAPNVEDRIVVQRNPRLERPSAIDAALEEPRAAAKTVDVPEKLHSLVARTMKLARKSLDDNGAVAKLGPEAFQVRAHPDTLGRLATFLNKLVYNALARGYRFERSDDGLVAIVDGERVSFKISQTIRRSHHVPTDEEKRAQRLWDERNRGNREWDHWRERPEIPHYDFTPTGEMSLELGGWVKSCQQRFADTRATKIEQRVDGILEACAAFAEGRKLQRQEVIEAQQRAEVARARHAEQALLEELERQRVAYAERKADQFATLDRLQRLFNGLAARDAQQDIKLRVLMTWLRQRLDRMEADLSPEAIAGEIANMPAFCELDG